MTPPAIRLVVNGEAREVAPGTTVQTLLSDLKLPLRAGIAVAVDDGVVARSTWAARVLQDGEQVLILTASQGG
jgi:sulfur carrier protein